MGEGGIRERSASVGIVWKRSAVGQIIEVLKIEGQTFESKADAERHC